MKMKKTAGKILAVLMLVAVAVTFSGCDAFFAALLGEDITPSVSFYNRHSSYTYVDLYSTNFSTNYYDSSRQYVGSGSYKYYYSLYAGNYTLYVYEYSSTTYSYYDSMSFYYDGSTPKYYQVSGLYNSYAFSTY